MTNQSQPRTPTHRLFTVREGAKTSTFVAIGAAWPNKDQQGFTLQLDALPLDGRIVMREIADREEAGGQS